MLCYVIYNDYTRDCHFDELEVEDLEYSEFAGQFIVHQFWCISLLKFSLQTWFGGFRLSL